MRACAAEFVGTAGLLAIVVGSGIMGERLASGNAALALLANSLATGAGLFVLIVTLAPASGAHFNPVVTLQAVMLRQMKVRPAAAYILVQVAGAICGVMLAHAMFGLDLVQQSHHLRSSGGEFMGEVVATSGLLVVIHRANQSPLPLISALVGCYITAAYWFTSSTSFANPAVTIARALTNTFAGIAPQSVGSFILAEIFGVGLAHVVGRILFARSSSGRVEHIARPRYRD